MTERRLMEGSEALARALVAAGVRFFAGYPMTPFTEVLEHMAQLLPEVGGVCMNAESELEAVGMAWGAAATGTLAATGSTGQGLSLMQESLSEITLARLPLIVLNMARAQGDYWQATRGGGHGDYRHLVLAPSDANEAVRLAADAVAMTQRWRNPVLIFGDYFLAHTSQSVELPAPQPLGALPAWALDGSSGGTGAAKLISSLGTRKQSEGPGYDLSEHYAQGVADMSAMLAGEPPRLETAHCEDADLVVVSFGTPARFVAETVRALRAEGVRAGYARPVSLVPFPAQQIAEAVAGARAVAVYENNTGQMVDDVRLALYAAGSPVPVHFIGGLSMDSSGFGIAPDYDVAVLRRRMLDALAAHPVGGPA
jgi:2-oxoglutarate/2-oxoacid ferredoxin oxidoreductase subunit alpha